MQEHKTDSNAIRDEEVHDLLIAISVVAKKLAKNISENQRKEGGYDKCSNTMD